MNNRYVIICAGIAGLSAAKAIREADAAAVIDIFTAENNLPYSRPMLTKSPFMNFDPSNWTIYTDSWFESNNISFHPATRIVGRDINKKTVFCDSNAYPYDKLIVACGAESFVPPIPGAQSDGVFTIRRSEDIFHIKKACKDSKSAVIIGGGVIGLEAATELLRYGQKVTILESMPYLMTKQIDKEISDMICLSLSDMDIHTGVKIDSIEEDCDKKSGLRVNLDDGRSFSCDLIIMACGVRAATSALPDFLRITGAVDIDEYCRTSDENIYAAGDCTRLNGVNYALWSCAMAQGRTAGLNAAADLCKTQRIPIPKVDTSLIINTPHLSLFALGDMGKNPEKSYEIKRFSSDETANRFFVNPVTGKYFEKLYFSEGKLVGAAIVGNLSNMQKFKEMIQNEG